MSDDELPRPRDNITEQLNDIITGDTTWTEIAEQLDVSRYEYLDPHPDWHNNYTDFGAMFKAIFWAEAEDIPHTGIPSRLEDNPELANAFGFTIDDLPHGDTFRNAYTGRFEDLQNKLEWNTENLNAIAEREGCPIGTWGLDIPDTDGYSERTIQRLLRSEAHKIMDDEIGDLIYSFLDLPRPDDPIYDEEVIKRVLTKMSLKSAAANDTGLLNGDDVFFSDYADMDTDEYLDLPFYVDGPTGETILDSLHELEPNDITKMINWSAEKIFQRLKPYADFNSRPFLAIDISYVGYWGGTVGLKWLSGAPKDKTYKWCHKYATATIVGENVHLVVAMLPVGNAEVRDPAAYPGEETKSYRAGEVVRELLNTATDYVPGIRCVYADREFAAADVIKTLDERNLNYMIPAPRNPRLIKWLNQNVDEGLIVVKDNHPVHGPVMGGPSNERVETTLIGVPNNPVDSQYPFDGLDTDDLPKYAKEADAVPFYTNESVDDEIALDRRKTAKRVSRYVMRGGIETSYRKIKGFMPSTTSKDYSVRLFHFGFAVLMYNMWLMVDFLVQSGLKAELEEWRDGLRYKPRISAERFRNYVEGWVGVDIF